MRVPILSRRNEKRQEQLDQKIADEVEKAMSPSLSSVVVPSGATYPVTNGPNMSSPFWQTGGYGQAFDPLPRPGGSFDSLFGPGYPLVPDPLDPVEDWGRSQPRRSQYPVTWNIQLVDRRIPWSVLYGVSETCDLVNKCIWLKQDELSGYEWTFTYSKKIINQIMQETGETNSARASQLAQEKYGAELDRIEQFFERPDRRMGFTFSQWLREMIFNSLVFDGIAIYPQFTLGGDLLSLSNIDPSTIKVLRDNQGFVPQPPAPAYQQLLYGFPRGEFIAEDSDSDDVSGEFLHDQLGYYISRPTPRSVYGFSVVEEVLPLARIYMARQEWLASEYTFGVTPRMMMKLTEDTSTWTPEQLAAYEQIWNDRLTGQIQRRQQAFFLPYGFDPVPMPQVDQTYKNEYDAFLITQIASRFGVPASQVGVQAKAGLSGGKQMEGEMAQTTMFSSQAFIDFIIDCINDLARRFLGMGPEITAACNQSAANEEELLQGAQSDASDVGAGILTRNEVRARRGVPLSSEPEADQLAITTGTGVSFLAGQLAAQESMAQAASVSAASVEAQPQKPEDDSGEGSDDSGNSDTNSGRESSDSAAGTDEGTTDGDSEPGGTDSEDAATKELRAFVKFCKGRRGRGWRDFTFRHVDEVTAKRLNTEAFVDYQKSKGDDEAIIDYSGRVILPKPLKPGDKIVVEHSGKNSDDEYDLEDVDDLEKQRPKALAPLSGLTKARIKHSDHPAHELHDRIVSHYADKLVETFKAGTTGISAAITQAKHSVTKAASDDDMAAIIRAIQANVRISPKQAERVLQNLYGDSYLAGSHTAAESIGSGANVLESLSDINAGIDWSNWTPGWDAAADLVDDGGLQSLLDSAGLTIQGISDTAMNRLGNTLADGLASGAPVDSIASDMTDVLMDPDRAAVIASTECGRAMTDATLNTYDQNGVGEWEWLSEEDERTCPVCEDLDGQTFSVDDTVSSDNSDDEDSDSDIPKPPQHTSCRCVIIPSIDTSTTTADNSGENDSGFSSSESDDDSGTDDASSDEGE